VKQIRITSAVSIAGRDYVVLLSAPIATQELRPQTLQCDRPSIESDRTAALVHNLQHMTRTKTYLLYRYLSLSTLIKHQRGVKFLLCRRTTFL